MNWKRQEAILREEYRIQRMVLDVLTGTPRGRALGDSGRLAAARYLALCREARHVERDEALG